MNEWEFSLRFSYYKKDLNPIKRKYVNDYILQFWVKSDWILSGSMKSFLKSSF